MNTYNSIIFTLIAFLSIYFEKKTRERNIDSYCVTANIILYICTAKNGNPCIIFLWLWAADMDWIDSNIHNLGLFIYVSILRPNTIIRASTLCILALLLMQLDLVLTKN